MTRGSTPGAILVTGSSGDIGGALVARLRRDGQRVVTLGHAPSSRADVTADFTDDNAVAKTVKGIDAVLSGVVLCHGITERASLANLEPAAWRRLMDVNLNSVYSILHALWPRMPTIESIVVVSSTAGLDRSRNGGPHYTTSKAAVIGLAVNLAWELGELGVRVNAVCPGQVEGRLAASVNTAATQAAGLAAVPLARAGKPDEVASVIQYLLSPRASYVSGAVVTVAGGTHK